MAIPKTTYLKAVTLLLFYSFSSICLGASRSDVPNEEGVRWKRTFNNEIFREAGIDVDQVHEDLSAQELEISRSIEGDGQETTRNIVVARLSVITKNTQSKEQNHTLLEMFNFNREGFVSGQEAFPPSLLDKYTLHPPTSIDILIGFLKNRNDDNGELPVELKHTKHKFTPRLAGVIRDFPKRKNYDEQSRKFLSLLVADKVFSVGIPDNPAITSEIKGFQNLASGIDWMGKLPEKHQPQLNESRETAIEKIKEGVRRQLENLKQFQSAKDSIDKINQLGLGVLDAEQHLLAYLSEKKVEIISRITDISNNLKVVEAITLHIHSRLDLCNFCAPTLALELNRVDGIFQELKKFFTVGSHVPKVLILVSSRLPLKNAKPDRRSIAKEDEEKEIDLSQQPIYVFQKLAGQGQTEAESSSSAPTTTYPKASSSSAID